MSKIKICKNPECEAENPENAKFCRLCGNPLSTSEDDYTPGEFPDIDLRPVAVKPIRFVNAAERISSILLPFLLIFLYFLFGRFKDDFIAAFGRDFYASVSIGGIIFSFFIFSLCITGLMHYGKYSSYSDNADYIEEKYFMLKLKRIAKNKKLGLFDFKNKSILLNPEYDSITKFDEKHILLGKGNKNGLYSISIKKIIVPIEFDGIAPIRNGVIEVVKNFRLSRYDIHGNALK